MSSADETPQYITLIREAIMRVMSTARRYQTIIEAHKALLNVERLADEIQRETNGEKIIPIVNGGIIPNCNRTKESERNLAWTDEQ